MTDEIPISVSEAAKRLGIARSTLYGHLSDIEHLYGEDAGTHIRIGSLIKIYPDNFEEIKRRLACNQIILDLPGMAKPIEGTVTSSAKEYEKVLKYVQNLKKNWREKL
tara:strand:- start:990 stop:1313 length:324 start_codon:yes stop_codon:yes gene_type:complete